MSSQNYPYGDLAGGEKTTNSLTFIELSGDFVVLLLDGKEGQRSC